MKPVTVDQLADILNRLIDKVELLNDRLEKLEETHYDPLDARINTGIIASRVAVVLSEIEGIESVYMQVDETGISFYVVVQPGMFASLIKSITEIEMELSIEFENEAIYFETHDSRAFTPDYYDNCVTLFSRGHEKTEHPKKSSSAC